MANSELLYPQQQETQDGPLLGMLKDFIGKTSETYSKSLKEHRYHMRQMLTKQLPAFAPVYSNVELNSSGAGVMSFGGPQIGRRWVVRMVSFSDANSWWASMGSAQVTLCVGPHFSNSLITPNMVRWPFASGPNSATFSSDQMWIVPRDKVLLSITGGTSGQVIQGTIWLQDFGQESSVAEDVV